MIPALNRAKNAGIPVILINNPMKPGLDHLYVTEIADDIPKAWPPCRRVSREGAQGRRPLQREDRVITGVLAEGVAKDRLDAFVARPDKKGSDFNIGNLST